MKCILKLPGEPPTYIETTENTRTKAVYELLGNISPAFYSLTPAGSFAIAYDAMSLARQDVQLNFFATLSPIQDYPVTPIFGPAVFVRINPVARYTPGMSDFSLCDCTEKDMQHIERNFLDTQYQFELCERFQKNHISDLTQAVGRFRLISSLVNNWKDTHPQTADCHVLGKNAVKRDSSPGKRTYTNQELRSATFYPSSFQKHCSNNGLDDVRFQPDRIHILTKRFEWIIHHNNLYCERLERRSRSQSGSQSKSRRRYSDQPINSRNIFHVVSQIIFEERSKQK